MATQFKYSRRKDNIVFTLDDGGGMGNAIKKEVREISFLGNLRNVICPRMV